MIETICKNCGTRYRLGTDHVCPKRPAKKSSGGSSAVERMPSKQTVGGSTPPPRSKKSTAARKNARVMVPRVCEVCGKPFEAVPHEVKIGKARACSNSCKAKLASRPDQIGENNPNWKGGVPATEKNRRYIERHPEKHAAHLAMTAAIRRGELVRGLCEVCGDPKTDGHHDDYSKPLKVRWLCRMHHIEHHAGTQAPPVDTKPRADAGVASSGKAHPTTDIGKPLSGGRKDRERGQSRGEGSTPSRSTNNGLAGPASISGSSPAANIKPATDRHPPGYMRDYMRKRRAEAKEK